MRFRIPGRQATLCFVLVLIAATAAHGEESYTEQVTVTASRTPVSLIDTGSSVTILERDEIEARQSLVLADLLRGVPGLAVSRAGGAGSLTQIRVRGSEANHVLILVDGVAVNDVFAGDELPLELLTGYDIERIEIVRGPQSGLWGADAVAGVVNIITRGPVAGAAPEAEIEAGSFGTVRGAGRVGFGPGHARLELGGSYLDQDGENVSRTGGEEDGASNGTASLRFRWDRPRSPLSLDLSARHTDAEADFDAIDFVTTGLPVDDDRTTDTRLSLLHATGRWSREGSAWQHEARASVSSSDTETSIASSFDGSTAIDKQALTLQTSVELGRPQRTVGQRLTAALEHERREFEQRGMATLFGDPNQDQQLDSTGAVLEYRIGTPRSWSVSASLRHDRHSDFDNATTYRATVSYAIPGEGGTRLRASAGTGQKPPTFVERFGFFADTFVGNSNLAPETSRGWEVGVDQRLGERTRIGLTWFEARLKDEINGFFFDSNLGLFTARNEPADSDRSGVELTFSGRLADRTHLSASYTHTDATQPNGFGGNDEELRRPRHMAHLNLRHGFQRVPVELMLNVARTGSQTDLFFPPFPQPSQVVRLESYLLVDLTASYRVGKRSELFGRVENALDEEYEEVYGFATPGVGAYVGIRLRDRR